MKLIDVKVTLKIEDEDEKSLSEHLTEDRPTTEANATEWVRDNLNTGECFEVMSVDLIESRLG